MEENSTTETVPVITEPIDITKKNDTIPPQPSKRPISEKQRLALENARKAKEMKAKQKIVKPQPKVKQEQSVLPLTLPKMPQLPQLPQIDPFLVGGALLTAFFIYTVNQKKTSQNTQPTPKMYQYSAYHPQQNASSEQSTPVMPTPIKSKLNLDWSN